VPLILSRWPADEVGPWPQTKSKARRSSARWSFLVSHLPPARQHP